MKFKQFDTIQAIDYVSKTAQRGSVFMLDFTRKTVFLRNKKVYNCNIDTMLPCRIVLIEKYLDFVW